MKATGQSLSMRAFVAAVLFMTVMIISVSAQDGDIRLLVRGDDIGSSHAANLACIQSYREGIMRSVEVMVPCPWYKEAVVMLNENPGLDVGIHLTLTSEWEFYKWGPITQAPSLVDSKGYFLPMTSQRDDFPPNTGFRESNFDIGEVEKELRAQIEIALNEIKNVTHISGHMGTSGSTDELRALVEKLSKEYNLPTRVPMTGRTGRFPTGATPSEKVDAMVTILEDLKPGTYMFVEHPGLDTSEMRSIGHKGYRDVAIDREGVTQAFTADRVKAVIKRRGIKLVSYGDLIKEQ
ncbi:polysaccharide deacetylase family protein [Candidatus Latescibacterota bacterium]